MIYLARLGPALRRLRQYRDLRQYEAAEAAGITRAMVSPYERGRRQPSLANLVEILNAMGADFAVQRTYREVGRVH